MFSDFYTKAAELASQGKPFAIATVVRVEGSSSARRGSKAIIDPFGKLLLGWVGGGCAESAVRSEAMVCIETERPRLITVDMSDEQVGVGMPCGGSMDIFIEPVLPKPELLIVGHGRIAETLAVLGDLMGFSITVNDPAADRGSFPQAERLVTEDFDLTETPIGPKSFVVIATQHKRDHLWLEKALVGKPPTTLLFRAATGPGWCWITSATRAWVKKRSLPCMLPQGSTSGRRLQRRSR